jgi:hypothetical protein
MDLTTTEKIKRRVVNIIPDADKDATDATITLSNWLESVNTSNMKTRVSSFYMNNSGVPCFIPKWTDSLPPAGWQGTSVPPSSIANNTLGPDTLNYYWNFNQGNVNHGGIINMDASASQYPNNRPALRPSKEFEQLSNNYFWFFNTSNFLDLIVTQINNVISSQALDTYGIAMVRTAEGYGLYLPVSLFAAGWALQFSKTLIDLFQFKNKVSANSTSLYEIQFNNTPRSYYVPDVTSPGTFSNQSCLFVFSNYVPDKWFPFDQILLRTDMPIEAEVFFNNNDYVSRNYANILFAFKVSTNNPDGIYNFYTYDPDPSAGWISFIGTNTRDSVKFEFLLRFQSTKDVIAYPIKQEENFYFVLETISTL